MLLKHAQKGDLGFGWKFADFIEKKRPPWANSNRPNRR